MEQTKGIVHEGAVVTPEGTHLPTLAVEVDSELADEAMAVSLRSASAIPAKLVELGILSEPLDYGCRLLGCMQCDVTMVYTAPVPALEKEFWACPNCGPDAAVPISELFTPDDL